MFNTRPPDYKTCDDSVCYRELGLELLSVFTGMLKMNDHELRNVFVGSSWMTDPDSDTAVFVDWLRAQGLMSRINWTIGQDVLHGVVTRETQKVIDAVRNSRNPTLLIGRSNIAPAAECLDAVFWAAPEVDCWTKRHEVYRKCQAWCSSYDDAIIVWCTGLGLKATSWHLWREFPGTTHIGLGSLFDGLDGSRTREWMRHEHQPWWRPYVEEFLPYVRSFQG